MKKTFLLFTLAIMAQVAMATKHTIINSDFTFSPASISINVGDTVVWNISSIHNAIEVSLSTYEANGNTSNGGFSIPLGGGEHVFNSPGTYYYVCGPHASMGMKGIITVGTVDAVQSNEQPFNSMLVYPNPIQNNELNLRFKVVEKQLVTFTLYDLQGKALGQLYSGLLVPGDYEKTFRIAPELTHGIYFVQCRNGGRCYNSSFIKP